MAYQLGYISGDYPSYTGPVAFTGQWAYPSSTGFQLSVGEVLDDLGGWIKTVAGDVWKVVVDEFGRRILMKTGEVLSGTPLGPATAYAYVSRSSPTPWLIGGGVLVAALLLGRRLFR